MNKLNRIIPLAISLTLSTMPQQIYGTFGISGDVMTQAKYTTLQTAGLYRNVTIRKDERDVPYIEAANEHDVYFAQGYMAARDRLWQMDLIRRTAKGELSEILGQGVLEEDKRHRAFGFNSLAQQMVGRLSSPVRAAMDAYADGVNAFIQSLKKTSLPLEFRALNYEPYLWSQADSLIVGKLFAETLSTTWDTDMMRLSLEGLSPQRRDELLPSISQFDLILVGADKPVRRNAALKAKTRKRIDSEITLDILNRVSMIISAMRQSLERVGIYADELAASNNWVVNGRHSVTGKPLLANDPHLQPSVPSIWYMIHLAAPELHVAGATVPGAPGILIGHNDSIAWGITNVEADVQDIYIEKFDNSNPKKYMTPQGWRIAKVRREQIRVRKGADDPATEPVEHDITVTRHGPIIFQKDGAGYALSWTALDPTSNEMEVYYHINRARNWKEFRLALNGYTGFPLNFVYADVNNHIGYWGAGRYPIRKTGEGTVPYDGATSAGDWIGYIPFQSLPHLYDPPSGVIVTANNRIVGNDYPYYITHNWAAPFRARRIHNLLTSKEKLSVEDIQSIQADTYSYPDALFYAEIVKLGRAPQERSAEWQDMLAALDGSDGIMSSGSSKIAISAMMREFFMRRILASALGDNLAKSYAWSGSSIFLHRVITTLPREWLPKEFDSYPALVLASYKDALAFMKERAGPDRSKWTWGHIAQVRFQHPLANLPLIGAQFSVDPIPQNGGSHTVNRGSLVSMRFIADVGDWDNTRQGIALGQSGDPATHHWKDQLESWVTVRPQAFPFSSGAVAEATKETLVLAASVAK